MSYKVLLFCADEKAVRLLTQILSELEFTAAPSSDPFTAVKTLTEQRLDALIVDCDHEQNAALLFKSARNSDLNQSSLAIALVQGQGTIAKAFRIGANLVLTKPINAEQCKGTLRTARGLLRKAESSQPGVPSKAARSIEAERNFNSPDFDSSDSGASHLGSSTFQSSIFQSATEPAAAFAPQSSASAKEVFAGDKVSVASLELELEKEPAPKPDAADAALLESLPEPPPVQPASSPSISVSSKGYAWQTAAKSVDLGALTAKPSSSGGAAAAAPAKLSATQPAGDNFALDLAEAEAAPAKPSGSKKAEAGSDFSWSAAAQQQDASEEAARKRNFLIAAVIVLGLAAGLYFAWPRVQRLLSHSPIGVATTAVVAQPATPAPALPPPAPPASTDQSATADPNATPPASSLQQAQAVNPNQNAATPDRSAESVAGSGGKGTTNAVSPLQVSEGVSSGLLLSKVDPLYPAAAKLAHAEGTVQLEAVIAKDGSVSQVKVLSGKPPFTAAAEDAVKQWQYKPFLLNGDAVAIRTPITVEFKLPQDPSKN